MKRPLGWYVAAVLSVLALPLWTLSCMGATSLDARPGDWARAVLAILVVIAGPSATCAAGVVLARQARTAFGLALAWLVSLLSLVFVALSLTLVRESLDPRWAGLHDERVGAWVLPALEAVDPLPRDRGAGVLDAHDERTGAPTFPALQGLGATEAEGPSEVLSSHDARASLWIGKFPAAWPPERVATHLPDASDDFAWVQDPWDGTWTWPHGASIKGWDGFGRTVPCGSTTLVLVSIGPQTWSDGLLDQAVERVKC